MKTHFLDFKAIFALTVSAMLSIFSQSSAATYYWDGGTVNIDANGNGVSLGTVGNWNTTLTNWDQGSGLSHIAWNNSNFDTAFFAGTAGTVTLTAPITVGGLTFFSTSGYTIAAGAQGLTFGDTNNTISLINSTNVATSTATISGTVAGNNMIFTSINRNVASTLNLTGTSTGGWTGTTTLNAGMTLALSGLNQSLNSTTGITFNGGSITLTNTAGTSADNNRISSAAITTNGGTLTLTNTSGANVYAESIGSVELAGGQTTFTFANTQSASAGSQTLTLGGLTRLGASNTSSVLFASNSGLSTDKNIMQVAGISAATTGGQVIAPWVYTGNTTGASDYSIYDSSGRILSAAATLVAGGQASWTVSTDAYNNNVVTQTLGATRTITALRNTAATATLTLATGANLETRGILNGATTLFTVAPGTGGVLTTPSGGGNLHINAGNATTGGAVTISAPINDNGGAVTVVKDGLGTLTLSSTTSNFSGGTVVNAGTLTWTANTNLGSVAANRDITVNGNGTLDGQDGTSLDTLSVGSGGVANFSKAAYTFATTTGSGVISFRNTVGSKTLNLGNASGFTGTVQALMGGTTNANPVVQFSNIGDAAGSSLQAGGGNGDSGQTGTFTFNGGSSLTFNNRRIELVSRTTSNWGAHAILKNDSALANIWTINTDLSVLTDQNRDLRLGGTNAGNNAFNGVISNGGAGGTINVVKQDAGVWILGGTNTYTGTTTVNAGTLRAGAASVANVSGAFGNNSAVTMANTAGAALALNGFNTQIGSLTGGGTTGGHVTLGAATLTVGGNNSSPAAYAGNISGVGGSLSKIGNGILILSGTNSYTGGTSVTTGTLTLLNTNAKSSTGIHAFSAGTTLGLGVATSGSFFTSTDLDNAFAGTMTGNLSNVTVDATTNIGIDTTQAAFSYASNIGSVSRGLVKLGSNALTLSGNNSYTGGTTLIGGTLTVASNTAISNTGTIAINGGTTIQSNDATARSFTNALTIGGDFTVGGTGNMTFSNTGASALGTTRQITVNTGINATFAQAFSGAGGLTKAGAGTLKLTGNNSIGPVTVNAGLLTIDGGTTSTGTFALPNASVSIINGGTLSTSSGAAALAFSSGSSMTITGGDGVTSTWNLNGGALGTVANNHNSGTFLIDGAGYAGSARVTNVSTLIWGRTLSNATLTLTNGGQMNVTGEIRTGVTYYNTTGNSDIIIGGGTATSTFTGNNQTFTIGYAERNGSKNNDVIVNSGGVLTGIGNMFVGHVLYGVALGTSTNNKLAVNGTGTASMTSVTVGYGQTSVDQANANLLEVTSGGTLTTSATNYIGRADVAGSTTNTNTATVTGTGSSWNANNQNVLVGFTNNATATSNNNIFTVSSGGSVTGINGLTIGSGTGTETGNQLVVNGGTLTAAALTVQTSNTASVGGTNGLMTVNGAFTGGGSATITGGRLTVTGIGTKNLPVTINGGDFRYNGSTNYTGTLTFTAGAISGTNWAGSLAGLTIGTNQTISPGNSPGTAATAAQTWASAGTYQWEINNTAGTKGVDPGWDWLNASGVLDITATSGSKFNIDITGLTTGNVAGAVSNWNAFTSGSWIIATGSSVTNFAADKFNLLTTNFANNNGVNTPAIDNGFAISQSGNDIILGYTGATTGYWDTNGSTAGAGGATPSGTWSTGATNWSSDSTGSSTTSVWGGTNTNAVFSAGADATDSYDVTISGGVSAQNITFDKGTVNVTGSTLTLVGTTPTITVNSTSAQISSVVDGTVGLTKAGTGTLILTGTNTYTGATTINNGILQLSGSGSINGSDVTVNGGSFINNSSVAYTGTLTLNNASLGGGTIDGDITYGGGGTVSGSSTVTGSVGSSSGSFSVQSGANLTVGTGLNVSGTAELILASTASVTGSINYSSSVNSTIEGVIAGSSETLTKSGNSTLTLTGTNTYTGATNVDAGKLVVNGNISSSSLTSVASGATIGGSGTVGELTVSSGGFINPGNSPGILNVSGDYTQAGLYTAEITGLTAGTEHDQINVTGLVDITGGSLTALFTAGTYAANDLIFILLNDGVDAITGTYSGFAQGATVIEYDGFDWKISYTANSTTNSFTGGNDIALMAIPEPKAALLGGLGLLLLLRRRR